MASSELNRLFAPESIALVGASGDPHKLSGRPYRYLLDHDYPGDIYLVNPSRNEIDGRQCYDNVTELPDTVDLAMVLVPAAVTPTVVRECGEADIPYAMVIASGFGEMGDDGETLEAELLGAARETSVRIIGPNSEGIVNVPDRIGASFSSILKRESLRPGRVSFLTQSGAFGGALFQLTQDLGVGAAKWLSTGNEADLSTVDFLEYLVEDPATDVVATYVEALSDGHRLREIGTRAAETETDIVAIRTGRSERGREATASHTGSIATDDAVYEAIFRSAGVTRVHSVDEFTDTVTAMARTPVADYPHTAEGVGVGVVSISGGAAALIADTCDRIGLPMADLDPATEAGIADRIPAYGAESNPVDVTGAAISQPELFEGCLRLVAQDPAVTTLVLQFGNSGPETLEVCKEVLYDIGESVLVATVFTGGIPSDAAKHELVDNGIHYFEDPVRAVTTIGKLATRAADRDRLARLPMGPLPTERAQAPSTWAAFVDAADAVGLPLVNTRIVTDPATAAEVAESIGYPVVAKYSPLAIGHKAELDGVKVGLTDGAAVQRAVESLREGAAAPIVLQEMVTGTEVIVGIVDDPDFGPVLMVGPGGTFVELLGDVSYRGLPISHELIADMIDETVLGRLLGGFRGAEPANIAALQDAILAAVEFYTRYDLSELEFNPILVNANGAVAVDVLLEPTGE